MYGQTKQEATF